MENIYTVDDPYVISCEISEVISSVTVDWKSGTNDPAMTKLTIAQGKHDKTSQTSTLTLSKAQILALKATSTTDPTHIFTCTFTVGTSKTVIQETQTIKIYTPGKHPCMDA